MSPFNNQLQTSTVSHPDQTFRIDRITVLLKDKETKATIYPIFNPKQLPENLLLFLTQEYNDEIVRGDTQPFFDQLSTDQFRAYWFSHFAAVMVMGDAPELNETYDVKAWSAQCLGSLFIMPNYPGRSSHVCTGNILVNAGIRHLGIGTTLADCMMTLAPRLGYSYALFELVFDTNSAAKKIFKRLHFNRVGKVKGCGLMKNTNGALVDALMYGRELYMQEEEDDATGAGKRHTDIKRYLTSGQYPENATRQEKSRLRALSYHYAVRENKLFLKDKEVISDVNEQFRIANRMHKSSLTAHHGINKTTSLICEKYHWPKVKETVSQVIRNCPVCKETARSPAARMHAQLPRGRRSNVNSKLPTPELSANMRSVRSSPAQVSSIRLIGPEDDPEALFENFPQVEYAQQVSSDEEDSDSSESHHVGQAGLSQQTEDNRKNADTLSFLPTSFYPNDQRI